MKMGRVQNKSLDELVSRIKKILSRKSSHSVAYVLAPYLVSVKTLNSQLRGETRHWGCLITLKKDFDCIRSCFFCSFH